MRSPPPPNQPRVVTSMRVFMWAAGTRGAAGVGDDADAAGPEAWVLLGTGDGLAELGAELAEDGGDVDADLLEDAALHDADDAAAAELAGNFGAGPGLALEAARAGGRRGVCLDGLELGADLVPEGFEPGLGLILQLLVRRGGGSNSGPCGMCNPSNVMVPP